MYYLYNIKIITVNILAIIDIFIKFIYIEWIVVNYNYILIYN